MGKRKGLDLKYVSRLKGGQEERGALSSYLSLVSCRNPNSRIEIEEDEEDWSWVWVFSDV